MYAIYSDYTGDGNFSILTSLSVYKIEIKAVHLCGKKTKAGIFQALLTHGANTEARNQQGVTALTIAHQNGHLGVVEVGCSF